MKPLPPKKNPHPYSKKWLIFISFCCLDFCLYKETKDKVMFEMKVKFVLEESLLSHPWQQDPYAKPHLYLPLSAAKTYHLRKIA